MAKVLLLVLMSAAHANAASCRGTMKSFLKHDKIEIMIGKSFAKYIKATTMALKAEGFRRIVVARRLPLRGGIDELSSGTGRFVRPIRITAWRNGKRYDARGAAYKLEYKHLLTGGAFGESVDDVCRLTIRVTEGEMYRTPVFMPFGESTLIRVGFNKVIHSRIVDMGRVFFP